MSKAGLDARRAALALATGVREGRALAEQVAAADGPLRDLAPSDRARAQRLALALFRDRARADRLIDPLIERRPSESVRDILRLATIEMCALGEAAHGVVDSAVSLTRAKPKQVGAAGMVNAVLRRIAGEGPAAWAELPVPRLPGPLRKRLSAVWGPEVVAAMELAHHAGAPLDLTPRDGEADALAARLGGEVLPTGSVRLRVAGQVSALPGYDEGAWWVQDAAAALPVRMLDPAPGARVADLCAAPGGKTLQLAARGCHVTAVDMSDARLGRLRQNLSRCGLEAEVAIADATRWQPDPAPDAVLVDAPCSATGTIRRHPDLPFARRFDKLDALTALQARLLDHALDIVRPGGRVVYCTCSLLPEEGEGQLAALRARRPEIEVLPPPDWADPAWHAPGGGLRTRPDHWAERGGLDGFYMVTLRKPV